MPQNQMTNTFLSKLLSAEMLSVVLITVFTVGVSWASLKEQVDDMNQRVDLHGEKQEQLNSVVSQIKTDIQVIRVDQKYTKDRMQELKDDIRSIRQLLEQRGK